MFKHNLENVPLGADVDFDKLVGLTDGYSGADIAEICDRAKEDPLNIYIKTDVEEPVSMKYIEAAIKKVKPTVSKLEIKRFEAYAGIDKEEVKTQAPKEEICDVKFAKTQIQLLPNQKPVLEFTLSRDFEKVYLAIDGSNYICNKKLASWESEPLNIKEAGTYDVEITSNNFKAVGRISFTKGLEEDDLGL